MGMIICGCSLRTQSFRHTSDGQVVEFLNSSKNTGYLQVLEKSDKKIEPNRIPWQVNISDLCKDNMTISVVEFQAP